MKNSNKIFVTSLLFFLDVLLVFFVFYIGRVPIHPQTQAQQLSCSFVQANCTWNAVTGATGYQVKITESDSNTVVKDEQVSGATTKVIFPVTQNKTYKCDVSAINACGEAGPVGTQSLLCAVDAMVSNSPTPTTLITRSPTPTLPPGITPIATRTPMPTLPPTGTTETTLMFGAGAFALIVIGGLMFIL